MPSPSPLTIDKIGEPIALFLDSVRGEIEKAIFGPVLPVERTIARRRNELDFGVANCALDSGCIIEGNDQTYKEDGTQERVLHVTTPIHNPYGIELRNQQADLARLLYEAKMS